jgi:hypothetical protein
MSVANHGTVFLLRDVLAGRNLGGTAAGFNPNLAIGHNIQFQNPVEEARILDRTKKVKSFLNCSPVTQSNTVSLTFGNGLNLVKTVIFLSNSPHAIRRRILRRPASTVGAAFAAFSPPCGGLPSVILSAFLQQQLDSVF